MGIQLFGLGISVIISGFVVLFGVLARRRVQWAFIVGMVLYALDGMILLTAGDWLGAIFHAWVLIGLMTGFQACRKLDALDSVHPGMMNAA
jgi:hypothetical protein